MSLRSMRFKAVAQRFSLCSSYARLT
jgi:hypothetical protein